MAKWGVYGRGAIGKGWVRDRDGNVVFSDTEEAAKTRATTQHLGYQQDFQMFTDFIAKRWPTDLTDHRYEPGAFGVCQRCGLEQHPGPGEEP